MSESLPDAAELDEASVERLATAFCGRIRRDALLGPLVEKEVVDWDVHIVQLRALITRCATKAQSSLSAESGARTAASRRWLELLAETATEVCSPRAAAHLAPRAARIAESIDFLAPPPLAEFSSSACAMREADDAYMGYSTREELTALLNELLEAERAGARVALETARAAAQGALGELLRSIHQDEARWCALLMDHLRVLGVQPSATIGDFYARAMAIEDLYERLTYLNRGQGWVARRLRESLPRVRDDRLHSSLSLMLQTHDANIAAVNALGR